MSLAESIYTYMPDPEGDFDGDVEFGVGAILRRTREHYQQSPEDVERAIRVRAEQIVDIERDSVESLPGPVYAVGFVRAYSEYLGLDGDKMVAQFKAQKGADKKSARLEFPLPSYDGKLPSKWVVWLSLFLVLAGPYTIWGLSGGEAPVGLEIQPVPESMKVDRTGVVPDFSQSFSGVAADDALDGGADVAVAADDPLPVDTDEDEVLLNVLESTWVEIKNAQGIVLISKVLESGEQYYVPNDPTLMITIGDGGVVQYRDEKGVFVDFGQKGVSVRNKPLRLLKDFPKPPPMPVRAGVVVGSDTADVPDTVDSGVDIRVEDIPSIDILNDPGAVEAATQEMGLDVLDVSEVNAEGEAADENALASGNSVGIEESQVILFEDVPLPPRMASEGKAQAIIEEDDGVAQDRRDPQDDRGRPSFRVND